MTTKQTLELLLAELQHVKSHMPNGELKQMQKDMEKMKQDVSELKSILLDPADGVIVSTNKNTEFRKQREMSLKEDFEQSLEIVELTRWKGGVTKALWIIFGSLAALLLRILVIHNAA